jgi:hypothetical protein
MYVIVKTKDNDLLCGDLSDKTSGRVVVLENARQIFEWRSVNGTGINNVANNGFGEESKLTEPVELMIIHNADSVIKCKDSIVQTIRDFPSYVHVVYPE